jgi:hypothetical protein
MAACEVEEARDEAGNDGVGEKCPWLDSGRPVGVILTAIYNEEMPDKTVFGALKSKNVLRSHGTVPTEISSACPEVLRDG